MTTLRPAYLAGQWYPKTAERASAAIESHRRVAPQAGKWRMLVSPHAGWRFSGDAMASGFDWLATANPHADLVVVFGSHKSADSPSTVFLGDAWESPLGPVATARTLATIVARELGLSAEPCHPAHPDNAVEVLVPFVRHFFPRAEMLMLGLPPGPNAVAVGERLATYVRDSCAAPVIVASTDLTHYGPTYGFAPAGTGSEAVAWVRENDRGFIDATLARDPDAVLQHALRWQSACCPGSVAAGLALAAAMGFSEPAREVQRYLSCDVEAGDNFVGYAAVVL